MSTAAEQPSSQRTLVPLLREQMVPWDTLERRYGPLLELVSVLLGVVPDCDRYLEIWPPAFRSYNIMVPNFLNLPVPIFGVGGAPADVVGLSMYVSSRVAECPYCAAHCCSFAVRRGASPEKIAHALVADGAPFTRGELATIAVARSLARIPCELTHQQRDELVEVFGPARAEWIVLGAVMMGFLNKFMNTIGIELERAVVAETWTTLGSAWSPGSAGADLDPTAATKPPPAADGLVKKLRVLPLLPAAIRLDARWQKGVPKRWPEVGEFLRAQTGHHFPVLSRLQHGRAVRAIGSILRVNLDTTTTVVGLERKLLTGMVFAEVVADRSLAADMAALASHHGLGSAQVDAAVTFARDPEVTDFGSDHQLAAIMELARAASPSPAEISAEVVTACQEAKLPAAAIVEVTAWLAVLQMLHRLACFFIA